MPKLQVPCSQPPVKREGSAEIEPGPAKRVRRTPSGPAEDFLLDSQTLLCDDSDEEFAEEEQSNIFSMNFFPQDKERPIRPDGYRVGGKVGKVDLSPEVEIFIKELCSKTWTHDVQHAVLEAVHDGIVELGVIRLCIDAGSMVLSRQLRLFIATVWLISCHRCHFGVRARQDKPTHELKALFHAGLSVVGFDDKMLRNVICDILGDGTEEFIGTIPPQILHQTSSTAPPNATTSSSLGQHQTSSTTPPNTTTSSSLGQHQTSSPISQQHATLKAYFDGAGRLGLAVALLKIEEQLSSNKKTFIGKHREFMKRESVKMLMTIEGAVIEAMIDSSLISQNVQRIEPVSSYLDTCREHGDKGPGIYINFFVDKSGMSSTPAHYLTIIGDLRRYINPNESQEDDEWANKIDTSWCPLTSMFGIGSKRRYLDFGARKGVHSHKRRGTVQAFLKSLEQRVLIERKAGRHLVPLQRPLSETGYSIAPLKRIAQHSTHRSSNYIMNLVEALSIHRYGAAFRVESVVVYNVCRVEQAWLAEMVITNLTEGYTTDGRGFSHYQAGYSNNSAYEKLSARDWGSIELALGPGSRMRL